MTEGNTETHSENIDGVKVTVSCDVENESFNQIWSNLYQKIKEGREKTGNYLDEPEETTKRRCLNLMLQMNLQNGWFDWSSSTFFQRRDEDDLVIQLSQ